MPSEGVVPGEAQFKEEAGLPSWFSTVVCQGECVVNHLNGEKYTVALFRIETYTRNITISWRA